MDGITLNTSFIPRNLKQKTQVVYLFVCIYSFKFKKWQFKILDKNIMIIIIKLRQKKHF